LGLFLCRNINKKFEANLDQQLQNLDKMIEQKNTKELFAIVHTLKGSSRSAGLSSLHRALCDWEVKLKLHLEDSNLKALDLAVLLQNRLSEHVTLEHDITVLCDPIIQGSPSFTDLSARLAVQSGQR
jgi:HPt (histidine-containing phosphotransfer) domain-containing protein